MRSERRPDEGLRPVWWAAILIALLSAIVLTTAAMFAGTFRSFVPVTMTSDRSGLVMEVGGKVKLRGVEVGRVAGIDGGGGPVRLRLELDPDQTKFIPANIGAEIRATTAFGAKYVDLVYPDDPSARRLSAGAVITSRNVSTEVNTVFQNLTALLNKVDPSKLNGVLTALADGLRGQGPAMGQAITDANTVLLQINPRADALRRDFDSVKNFADTYGAAAGDLVSVLDAATTTSQTITANAAELDKLLLGVSGFAQSGTAVIGPSQDHLVTGINALESTTALLLAYNPELTCMLTGAYKLLLPEDQGGYGYADVTGGHDGRTDVLDVSLLLGDDAYKYPDNLPVTGAKGGPGGQPGCGSLPDVSKNYPQRYLVTNTGWGTGMDLRPNPGIGFPGYANYLPVTRAVPEPPSIRHPAGPAPGPDPGPGGPPYGAPMYAPHGSPLYPNEPPAPAPGAPSEPGPAPGSEPFTVPYPMQLQPTPTPTPPLPTPAAPAP
jgi:phospholipid/cholesterol/gamma-HCH transport system substrate-binding protein